MTDPVNLANASIGSSILGTGISAFGSLSNSKAFSYQSQVARNNQIIAEQNAIFEEQKGVIDEQTQRLRTAQGVGQEIASAGASGLDVNSGSKVDVRRSLQAVGDLDALTIRDNATRRSAAYRAQGANFGAEASLKKSAARFAMLDPASSILSGATSVADKWLTYKQQGIYS